MKKIFYLFCIAILYFAVYSCETPQDEKCWHIIIGVDIIDHKDGVPRDTFDCVIENYKWLPESKVEKEVDDIISELMKEYKDDDDFKIIITKKTWEPSKYETSINCNAADAVINSW